MVSTAVPQTGTVLALFRSLRPEQWVKNVLVFFVMFFMLGSITAMELGSLFGVFIAFCLAASAGYQVNDVLDRENDRRHETKRYRPIASGLISVPQALFMALGLVGVSLFIGRMISLRVFALVLIYLVVTTFYNVRGKKVFLLDIVLIGTLYGVRVLAGITAAAVLPQGGYWWVFLMAALATVMELGKRITEKRMVGDRVSTREVLARYTAANMNVCYSVLSGFIVIMYPFAAREVQGWFVATVVLVAAALIIYRRELLTQQEDTPAQEVLFRSRPLLMIAGLFCAVLMVGIYG